MFQGKNRRIFIGKMTFFLAICTLFTTSCRTIIPEQYLTEWVMENHSIWETALDEMPVDTFSESPIDADYFRHLPNASAISQVFYDSENELFTLCIYGLSNQPETSTSLVYSKSVDDITTLNHEVTRYPDWRLTYATETACRWEGGGANHKGYVSVTEVEENWYYVEIYMPT